MTELRSGQTQRFHLAYDSDPDRRIGVRVERPAENASGAAVVLCHGFKGFMDWGFFPWLSGELAAAGFVAVSMNASGCGIGDDPLEMSDEDAFFRDTYTRQLEDMARVREVAAGLDGVDPKRVALLGHSRGGGMAVISAAENPCASLVTWAAIDAADRFSDCMKEAWREDGELRVPNGRTGQTHRISVGALDDFEANAARLDIGAAAGRLTMPLLAIHGREDQTVKWESAVRLAEQAPYGESLIIPGANHGFGATHPLGDARPEALRAALDATLRHLDPLVGSIA